MRCGLEVEVYPVAPLCRHALVRVYHSKPMDHGSTTVVVYDRFSMVYAHSCSRHLISGQSVSSYPRPLRTGDGTEGR